MAASAGVADVCGIDRRCLIGMFENGVLAVAVGAKGRLRNATGQGLAMDAGAVLLDYIAVAHCAGVGDSGAKGPGFRSQEFMRASVAQTAIGRAVVTGFARLAVNATRILPSLVLMAG